MKKSIMSVIVIFITIVSVIIMLNSSGNLNINFSSAINFKDIANSKVRIISNGFKKYIEIIYENKKIDNKSTVRSTSDLNSTSQESMSENGESNEKQQKVLMEQTEDASGKEYQKSNEIVKEDAVQQVNSVKKYNNVVLFRVSKDNINKSISDEDKSNLLSIANKISPLDYLKIDSYLKNEDVETAIVNTVLLLKTRLSRKDYEKFREIADKYIDIERVEKALKV